MIDYEFKQNNKDLKTKKLKGSSVWQSKENGEKQVARRAFSGSDSKLLYLLGEASQKEAILDVVSKISMCHSE